MSNQEIEVITVKDITDIIGNIRPDDYDTTQRMRKLFATGQSRIKNKAGKWVTLVYKKRRKEYEENKHSIARSHTI